MERRKRRATPMKVTLKLFASLTDWLPADARASNRVELEFAEPPTVQQVIDRFALPAKSVHLVLINGSYVYPPDRATKLLAENDVLAIWPPIAGG
jgi:sulfur-carrier protein